jgi:hypothetical protein
VALHQVAATRKQAQARPTAAKPEARTTEPMPPVRPSAASPAEEDSGKGGIRLDDIATAKALLQRVGAQELRKLIDLLAK